GRRGPLYSQSRNDSASVVRRGYVPFDCRTARRDQQSFHLEVAMPRELTQRIDQRRPSSAAEQGGTQQSATLADSRPATAASKILSEYIHRGDRMVAQRARAERLKNRTGMPDALKSGIETLSGVSLDDVRVHYNSSRPVQLNAHAYAQGSAIHVAPG